MPTPSRYPVNPPIAPAPAPWPLARSVSLAMLAFSLAAVALLAYMNLALISQPVQDRFTNPKNTHTQRDPFRLNGCIDLSTAAAPCDAAQAEQFALNWPPHADYLATRLHQYVAPRRGHSPNQQMLQTNPALPTPITQGRHLTLGIERKMQELAQTTAACFAGDAAACQRCHWCDARKAPEMYEHARARALGILVVNAKTGTVQAAASAYTPCYAAQQRGEPPAAACPVLPNTRVPHLDRLGSQALEQTAKPGSITKLPIALGLLKAGLSADEAAQLPRILSQSLTPELIDIVMCRAQKFDPSCARKRLSAVADAARELGWQGQADVLGAGQLPGLSAQRFTGRMLQPAGKTTVAATTPQTAKLSREALQACANKPKAQRWRNCSGADLVNLLAELFGTGDALASPVGVANAFLHLSAAANAAPRAAQAHLVVAAQNDAGQHHAVQAILAPQPSAAQARQVLQGMALATTEGTARTACDAAAKAWPGGLLPCASQDKTTGLRSGLRITGKTGTPVMSADAGEHTSKTLPQWLAQCTALRSELGRTRKTTTRWYYLNNESGKCNATGVKWYAFLVSAPGSTTWDHVVVVLAERNWSQKTQLIDSPNDRGGPNVAAEAGLSLANALYRP